MAFPTTTSAYDMDGVGALPSPSLSSTVNSAADQIERLYEIQQANNAMAIEQARIQRDWQEKQNAKAMEFNRVEAEKNRNWQETMSNTAHQREIADLKAAGLNPVLSAMGGNGASVTSGATASGVTSSGAKGDVDTSLNSALVNLLGSVYNRTTQLEAANINARTQEAVADKYNATSEIVAQIAAAANRYGSDNALKSALNAAATSFESAKYSSQVNSGASKYVADTQAATAKRETTTFWDALKTSIDGTFDFLLGRSKGFGSRGSRE